MGSRSIPRFVMRFTVFPLEKSFPSHFGRAANRETHGNTSEEESSQDLPDDMPLDIRQPPRDPVVLEGEFLVIET